jgi:hypothetical protein
VQEGRHAGKTGVPGMRWWMPGFARVEAQSAISRLYGRYPNLALAAPDNLQWMDRAGLRGLTSLPLRLNAEPVRRAA